MKKCISRNLLMFLTMLVTLPFLWGSNTVFAEAATPSLTKTKLTLEGTGDTFDINIKNKVSKSKYKWTSSNKKVVTVNNKGVVTSVGPGTTKLYCKITYPSKKTKTLICKVTVTAPAVPATGIQITDLTLTNGSYQMTLGDSLDLVSTLTPSNSTDKVYWSITGGDASCIRIDDTAEGKITAVKVGTVSIKAAAATASTPEEAAKSKISASVIIHVAEPSRTVKSVAITNSNTIKAIFDTAVKSDTVINADGTLSRNIDILLGKDDKNVTANDPGKLTAVLSADEKTLTITTEKVLSGNYAFNFSAAILTKDGQALENDTKVITYIDKIPPIYTGTTIDDTGYIATIHFSEMMDFSKLQVSGAQQIGINTTTVSDITKNIMNNEVNYIIGEDKASLSINLSTIPATDYNKDFSVYMSGITDIAGNIPANSFLTVSLKADTTPKPQAAIISVERTGYNIITVTYTRGIQYGGLLQINNGTLITGVVDSKDKKKVHYNMTDQEASYTGVQKVQVGMWNSYHVMTGDVSANKYYTYQINFSADVTSPTLLSSVYDIDTGVLTLTYNENVTLSLATGTMLSTYNSVTDEINSTNLNYSMVTHSEGGNVIKLKMVNMNLAGVYTFSLPLGFVKDAFNNSSIARAVVIENTNTSVSSRLPDPYQIYQSTENLKQIYIKFAYKLDKTTAETVGNYTIPGVEIVSAALVENLTDKGATVVLTLQNDSVAVEASRPITIKGVRGYDNSYGAIEYTSAIILKENKRPFCTGVSFDRNTFRVTMTFNENIMGTLKVNVTQNFNGYTSNLTGSVTIEGCYAYIYLSPSPSVGSYLMITPQEVSITDTSGNAVVSMPSYTVGITY